MELTRIMTVEIPEINQFASRINLCLKRRLALIQHRGCVDLHSPFASQHFCTSLKDGTARLKTHVNPSLLCIDSRLTSRCNFGLSSHVDIGNHMSMLVWDDLCGSIACEDLLPIDDTRDFDNLAHLPI